MGIVVGLLVAAVACSSGDNADDSDNGEGGPAGVEQAETPGEERAAMLAEALESNLGAEEGFNGLVYAWERGYSHAQVFAAIEDDRLQADGNIQGADGNVEEPASSRLGVVILPDTAYVPGFGLKLTAWRTDPPPARSVAAPVQEPNLTVEEIRAGAESLFGDDPDLALVGDPVLASLFALALAGYSAEQITEQLILGGNAEFEVFESVPGWSLPELSCMVLRDPDGTVIAPSLQPEESEEAKRAREKDLACFAQVERLANDPSGAGTTGGGSASQEDEGEADPEIGGLYRGEMTLVQCRADCSATCEVGGEMQLGVTEDGHISGGLPAHARWDGSGCLEPLTPGWVVEGEVFEDGFVYVTISSNFDSPATAAGELKDGTLTLTLEEDPLVDRPGGILALDAVLTKE